MDQSDVVYIMGLVETEIAKRMAAVDQEQAEWIRERELRLIALEERIKSFEKRMGASCKECSAAAIIDGTPPPHDCPLVRAETRII